MLPLTRTPQACISRSPMKLNRPLLFSGACVLCAILSGCNNKQEVKVYRVSKEAPESAAPDNSGMPAAMPGAQGMPGMPGMDAAALPPATTTGQGGALTSTPPAGW